MKRIALTLVTLLAGSLSSMAQEMVFSRQNLLDDHPYNFYTGGSSERGHDRLDSLYYLNVNTYTMPYYKEKDKEAAVQYILKILETYDKLMETATGGFKSSSPVEFGQVLEESKRLSMYYAEELDPFVIGGKGRNYVVVRQQDPHNMNYRTCEGVEWWLEVPGCSDLVVEGRAYDGRAKKNAVVKFRVFSLYGPLTEKHYERAFNEHLDVYGRMEEKVQFSIDKSEKTTPANLIEAIRILAAFYKDNGSTTDAAVVNSINERVSKYFSSTCRSKGDFLSKESRLLYHILGKIPGYGVSVLYPDGLVVTGDFEWFANHYPQGNPSEINWYIRGDAKCQGECRNFLLELKIP